MPAPTPKQRRAAKQRDSLGWARNAKRYDAAQREVRPYIGAHVKHTGSGKLGTVKDLITDETCMTRAIVHSFNGEAWDWQPPITLLEVI